LLPLLPTRSVGAIAEQQQPKSDGVGKGARNRRFMSSIVPGAFAHPTIR
jgi:hypothetical protein